MKTVRGCLVIFFSFVGLSSLAQSLDPVSDDAKSIEEWEYTSEVVRDLKIKILEMKSLNQDTASLEEKLEMLEAEAGGNGRS